MELVGPFMICYGIEGKQRIIASGRASNNARLTSWVIF